MAITSLKPLFLGDFLVEKQCIDDSQLLDALAEHWSSGVRIGDVLVQKGFIAPDMLEQLVAEFHSLNTVYV